MLNLNTFKFISALLVTGLCSADSFAASDACTLLQVPLPAGLQMTAEEMTSYRTKLQAECSWKQSFDQFNNYLKNTFQLDSRRVTEYQAMRFIRRIDFETSKRTGVPVDKTYQVRRDQYSLPNEQKPTVIWDNWELGIRILDSTRAEVLRGQIFDAEKLKAVHRGFFQLSTETGDFATIPYEGKFKSPQMQDHYWWALSEQEIPVAQRVVPLLNQYFTSVGLTSVFTEPYLNKTLDVRQTLKRQPPDQANRIEYVTAIYSAQTRTIVSSVNNVLGFLNSIIQQGVANQPLIWRNKAYTPAEAAYLAQKFYVSVHPFHEGNGRTSRFLQELILTSLDMPHGSSGELMDQDVLTTMDEYYNLAMQANANLMRTLQNCATEYNLLNGTNPAVAQQGLLNYSCRILNTRYQQ